MSKNINQPSYFMQQYLDIKQQNPDSILFFRMGDFYEMFNEDAITASRVLDLTLTRKRCGMDSQAPMCGVPYHSVSSYIARLMQAGFKVAICEQVTTPKPGQKLLAREVIKVITPGTVTELDMLEENKNNYLMCIDKEEDKVGIVYVDITTGEFNVTEICDNHENLLSDLITRVGPSEVITNKAAKEVYDSLPITKLGYTPKAFEYYEWAFTNSRADENLGAQFGSNFKTVYELNGKEHICYACGAVLEYIKETQKKLLGNINKITFVKAQNYMTIDMNTRRNLELVESLRDHKKQWSLLGLMDKTKTHMGARRLRKYFDQPLQDLKELNLRQEAVEELVKNLAMRDTLENALSQIRDVERLSGKISYGNIYPKDMVDLRYSFGNIPLVKMALSTAKSKKLQDCRDLLVDFGEMAHLLERAIKDEPPTTLKEGGFIKDGFNSALDEYRAAESHGTDWIKQLEAKEREETGIKNLRIDSNKVFGYYIEVSKGQSNLVPLRYQRKQTVLNNERYITEDLKLIEEKIFGAKEKAIELEIALFDKLRETLQGYVTQIQQSAGAIAEIDALLSLAQVAAKQNFVRPVMNKNIQNINIVDGRHPVVEAFSKNYTFIPNDTFLDSGDNRTMIITGPNMAGKSTYMRQVAIITFLAHIGSFVPAKSAEIPIVDRIFTRVGASDDLVFGQSTFMVEMSEVALILANATDKSLIILDEIGRGTSTFDGLAIAWSVVEYISKNFKAKTLFATHYHELTELEGVIDGIKNYKVAVKETDGEIKFLRKIVRGGANKSFGIEVARLAGLPQNVLERANEISKNLDKLNTKLDLNVFKENKDKAEVNTKKAISILNRLKDIDINRVSPLHAFDLLNDLVNNAKGDE